MLLTTEKINTDDRCVPDDWFDVTDQIQYTLDVHPTDFGETLCCMTEFFEKCYRARNIINEV